MPANSDLELSLFNTETGWDYFGARYYDPSIARFLTVDRFANKYPSLTPYNYSANNPLFYVDVNGDSLDVVKTSDNKEIFVDKKISDSVRQLIKWAKESGIPMDVSEDFRTTKEQKELKERFAIERPDVKVADPGTSRHESGFALDIRTSKMTQEQKPQFEKKAKEFGLKKEVKGEPWHFQADPLKHGFKSRKAAIKENQAHYKELIKEKRKDGKKTN